MTRIVSCLFAAALTFSSASYAENNNTRLEWNPSWLLLPIAAAVAFIGYQLWPAPKQRSKHGHRRSMAISRSTNDIETPYIISTPVKTPEPMERVRQKGHHPRSRNPSKREVVTFSREHFELKVCRVTQTIELWTHGTQLLDTKMSNLAAIDALLAHLETGALEENEEVFKILETLKLCGF